MSVAKKDTMYFFTQTTSLIETVQRFQSTRSVDDLDSYVMANFAVKNFKETYVKALPYLKSLKPGGRDSSMASMRDIFSRVGIKTTSPSFAYVKKVIDVFSVQAMSADGSLPGST